MWVAVKVVLAGAAPIIGCVAGPFDNRQAAEDYGEKAVYGSLGYERWIVRELEAPKEI